MISDIARVLYREPEIHARLDCLAAEIAADYAGRELTVVSILNGSFIFAADLLRRLPLPLEVDCWSVSSYHGTKTTGAIRFRQNEIADVGGRHVLLLDDILDTGRTLHAIREKINGELGAASVRACVLLRKSVQRDCPAEAEYVGFDVPDEFVVGYGLDYNGHYRNLPFVGVLNQEGIRRYERTTTA